jgi:hypothetical protein
MLVATNIQNLLPENKFGNIIIDNLVTLYVLYNDFSSVQKCDFSLQVALLIIEIFKF